ncbi:MAG: ExeM/NucH family extracellular endonuclease, partial [Acidimicrobiia bacterium]|nr:ExeM/NucH family extracellular endonuclease [Acidimicrobiia bacterium]
EFHYDNAGTDTGEFIEIAGPAGTDLTGWSLVLYNGSNGLSYDDAEVLSGVLGDQSNGYGFVVVDFPSNGIQNGSPDGMALVNGSSVVQFLSYEGTFSAANGPANGDLSTDIGVAEAGSGPVGGSIQLTGSGATAGDFTWTVTDVGTNGAVNTGQTFTGEPTPPAVTINEIDYDQEGTDSAEFIELYNSGGEADLAGWTIQLINGAGGGATVYNTIPLDDTTLAPGGFLVVCANATTVANCDIDGDPDTNFIQNGAPDAVALLNGTTIVDVVSYEGDTAGFVEGSGVGLVDDPADGARSISRLPDGADTNQNNIDFVVACVTPGEANADVSTGCGGPVFIHEIQGSGDVSPLVGQDVTIEGIVVGDYEGPSPTLRGFYVQEEDADADGDDSTSEGIFVFHGSVDSVNLGDQVSVTGTVAEFQGQTQLGFPSELEVVSSGNAVTPAPISLPLNSADSLEAVEGMLVEAAQTLYVTEFFQLGRFGQVVVSGGDRLPQPTAIAEPGPDSQAVQAANDLNRLIVDDTLNNQNPDPIIFGRDGNELTAENTLRGGDTLTGAVGVMTYTWAGNNASGNAYRLRPASDGETFVFEAANERPSGPPDVGGSLQVASFNVLNYFTTIDFTDICGPTQDQDCRGADSELELERQRVKVLQALLGLDADVVGLVEVENTPGANPEADLASGLNDLLGGGSYAHIDAAAVGGGVVGTDAIRVGMIYRPDAVTPVGDPALLDFSLDPLGQPRSRTAVAQTFVENATGEVFTAVVNHFKSKSGSEIDDSGGQCSIDPSWPDCDQGDGAGYFNATRTVHAAELVAWLDGDPTGSGDDDVLILGDLNSYAMEDPIDVLTAAGYVDLTPDDYSYVFDGQWGSLDYALASPSMAADVSGAGHYHINADEPSVLDYNTDFKTDNHVEILFAPDEFRTSDHDPALVGLDLGPSGFEGVPTPASLWPPNHKYRAITVGATGSSAPLTVEILAVESSEADSGLDPEDVPNDIEITGDDTVNLRAERFSTDGRTYTLYLRISDGSQTLFTTAEVIVPANQGKGGGKSGRP